MNVLSQDAQEIIARENAIVIGQVEEDPTPPAPQRFRTTRRHLAAVGATLALFTLVAYSKHQNATNDKE